MNTKKLILLIAVSFFGVCTEGYSVKKIISQTIDEFSSFMPSIRYARYARSDLNCNVNVQKFFLSAGTLIALNNARLIGIAAKNMVLPGGWCNTTSDLAYACAPLAMSEMLLYTLLPISSLYQELASKKNSPKKPIAGQHTALWKSIGKAGSAISAGSYGCLLGSIALWGATKIITTVKQI